ncbi:WD repeat-containing protein 3-like [Gossypium australe]|uniref:WD repeat-containing protein 3-like n=1 Tax=Gossypium australe TaxID=47621 RepID=A0A5B6W6K3_9ROSI|nr:WD repeat-containing protein 3-like [Gossypium australe]
MSAIFNDYCNHRLRILFFLTYDEAQNAFIPGRMITNNVLIAYEMLHALKRKKAGNKALLL